MSKWFMEGLFVGSTALIAGGTISLMTANASNAVLATGAVGGISTAITSKRRNHNLKDELRRVLLSEIEDNLKNFVVEERKLNNQTQQEKLEIYQKELANKYETLTKELNKSHSVILSSHNNQESLLTRISKLEIELQEIKQDNKFYTEYVDNNITEAKVDDLDVFVANPKTPLTSKSEDNINVSKSANWLISQGISINNIKALERTELSKKLTEVSIYLGNNYTSLKSLHNKLARSSETGSFFRFCLQARTQEDIRINTSFASLLKKLGYLSNYFYSKTDKVMHITPHRNDEITRFLWGDWFEKFIYEKTKSFLVSKNINLDFVINPEVTFPNGDSYELDIFMTANNEPIWIECKAGRNYDAYLQQYSIQRKILDVPKKNALVVSLQIEKDEAIMRSELWDVTILNPEMLDDTLNFALFGDSKNTSNVSRESDNVDKRKESELIDSIPLSTLKEAGIKPVTKHRKIILSELIDVYSDSSYSENFLTLKTHLMRKKSIINNEISSTSISNVLKALLHARIFLDTEKKTVKSYNISIDSLVSLDENSLDKFCIGNYVKQVLKIDADFFSNEKNMNQFEEFVGGKFCSSMLS